MIKVVTTMSFNDFDIEAADDIVSLALTGAADDIRRVGEGANIVAIDCVNVSGDFLAADFELPEHLEEGDDYLCLTIHLKNGAKVSRYFEPCTKIEIRRVNELLSICFKE